MIEVGSFVIAGDWDSTPTPSGKLRIVMPPLGHVYGGGWQPFTQAGLRAVAAHLKAGNTFAEIGCGSGILCVAAKLLGAGECYATDLNKDALAAAARVFEANNLTINLIEGTLPNVSVDLAVITISTQFANENRRNVRAGKILLVNDDATVEVI